MLYVVNRILLPSERDREFLEFVFYTASAKGIVIRHVAGARHIPFTEQCQNCDTSMGLGPNQRDPFEFHDAVIGFVS